MTDYADLVTWLKDKPSEFRNYVVDETCEQAAAAIEALQERISELEKFQRERWAEWYPELIDLMPSATDAPPDTPR